MYQYTIWTIGHSTHTFDEFASILLKFKIELLADIRNFPGSKRYPHFNKEFLENSLPEQSIEYIHLQKLGGRRKPRPDSINNAWKHDAFKGYADHMETDDFQEEVNQLEQLAKEKRTAFMCSESLWWRCHRSLVADYFKSKGWKVIHIMSNGKEAEHPYTSPAKIINGKLSYTAE
jgi:uncharacterized protein (DUF488 family)